MTDGPHAPFAYPKEVPKDLCPKIHSPLPRTQVTSGDSYKALRYYHTAEKAWTGRPASRAAPY